MTRIIGGAAGGRRLRTPGGENTRPTSDRVREALFSTVESHLGSVTGLRFLDLYAGSGAVGLEAMSRGAAVATLVEQDRRTASLIRANARELGLTSAEVVAASVTRYLAQPPRSPYDIVFADPPYALDSDVVHRDLTALVANGWISGDALVIVERPSRGAPLVWPDGLVGDRSRKYGETTLWYGHADGSTRSP